VIALRELAARWRGVVPSSAKLLVELVMEAARRFMPTKKNTTTSKPAPKKGSKRPEAPTTVTENGGGAAAAGARADLTKSNEALRQNPDDVAALKSRSKALLEEYRFVDALADLGQLIRLEPKEPRHHFERGRARESLDQVEWALDDYRRALSADKNHAPARRNLVALLRRLGRDEEAGHEEAQSSKGGKK
jgi:tetratricopeptide (TPR) repeat protein